MTLFIRQYRTVGNEVYYNAFRPEYDNRLMRLSDQNTVAVVDLVLDYFSRPAGEGLEPELKFFILPLNLDSPEAPDFSAPREGETALFSLIRPGLLHDYRVEHDLMLAVVFKGDDALIHADHVGGHAHAAILVGDERVEQILRRAEVVRRGGFGLPGEKGLVFAYITYHCCSSRCPAAGRSIAFARAQTGD